jgi:hypothetical protein
MGAASAIAIEKGDTTMICIERLTQQVRSDKWVELQAIDARFNSVESRLGFPLKRRYRCYFGGHNSDTLIVERQWESLAAMEAAYEQAFADPEFQALGAEATSIIANNQYELYAPLP